jgi:predicted AAA+ superfamily ATPase
MTPKKQSYIPRDLQAILLNRLATFPSVVVSGPRQSGKSTLLLKTLPDYTYITLDDPVTRERALADPNLFLDWAGDRVIIDEIQQAPQLLSYVKMRIDRQRAKRGSFVFTGSQQFALIRDLSDSLAGRIAPLDLLPFSLAEKARAGLAPLTLKAFVLASLRGSFPELIVFPEMDPSAWYGAYIQTYLERDVRTLYNIGNLRDFQRFIQLLAVRCAQVLNLSTFARDLGISVPTIKNWLSILEAGRIIYLLPPYHTNLGKRITRAPKLYFLDIGIVCYLTGIRDEDHLLKGPMAGALFENFCLQEIIKWFFHRGERANLYYLRTHNQLEIDLLIEKAFQTLIPVEFKLSKTPHPAMGSSLERFKKLFPSWNIEPGFLLSLSEESFPLTPNFQVKPLNEFLSGFSL